MNTNAHTTHTQKQKQNTTPQSILNYLCCAVRIDSTSSYKRKFGLRVLRGRLLSSHLFRRWHHWDTELHTVRASCDYGDEPRASRASSDLDPATDTVNSFATKVTESISGMALEPPLYKASARKDIVALDCGRPHKKTQ